MWDSENREGKHRGPMKGRLENVGNNIGKGHEDYFYKRGN